MKIQYFILMLAVCIVSCTKQSNASKYSEDVTHALIMKTFEPEQLDSADYEAIVSQLDGMFSVVYAKALAAVEKGVPKDSIKPYLASDPEYIKILGYAQTLDSALIRYMNTPESSYELRSKYRRVAASATRRANKIGLY